MKAFKAPASALAALALGLLQTLAATAADAPSEVTLFKNVNVFDGASESLRQGYDVLVVGNLIRQVARNIPTSGAYEIDVKTGGVTKTTVSFGGVQGYTVYTAGDKAGTEKKQVKVNVIDGGGRTLMPGLTDAHWHVIYAGLHSLDELRTDEIDYIHARMIK